MLTSILINPVVEKMYPKAVLEEFLLHNGYKKVNCQEDWGAVVKQKYQKLLQNTSETVVDMRCPMACKMVEEIDEKKELLFPNIEPILIHCAREISGRQELKGGKKVIITPCESLAWQGNALKLEKTKFYSWLSFLEKIGQALPALPPEDTPIPLGFFKDCAHSQIGISKEEEIRKFFIEERWKGYRLIELLYCEGGCHNGDGVWK